MGLRGAGHTTRSLREKKRNSWLSDAQGKGKLRQQDQGSFNAVIYDDVHINFTQEEWALLNSSQKSLYKDVMLDTYRNLTAIGYSCEDHNIEEHCQSSRRHRR
ncbi:zinc finger protein 431-like isoform X2 [Cricetulus griseus]|uniref:Zinc finger protein 431-like isoform X2 n=2 Tax=Cricetulus griseus TaxID=10029 RepID=A0A9J7H6L2_CRIGR|nr:zinc finger protein 431-like isoform X2 [Cricetulus griseus]